MPDHVYALVGRRFTATIGDPWDFVSTAGQNRLEGEITAVFLSDLGQARLLCEISPFTISGVEVSQAIGINRYASSRDLAKMLEAGQNTTTNFAFHTLGHDLAHEDFLLQLSRSLPDSFLVGSMKLNPVPSVGPAVEADVPHET